MTLEIHGLEKAYTGFEFGPVDVTVDGGVLAVLGPSGSGKTTLLSLVAGTVAPDAGSVSLDGRELVGRPLEARNVGMVFQEGALFPHMTARENIEYAGGDTDRVAELTALLELDDVLDRRPAALSGGERQRVALARTLAADPDVLLLDEPLSSLDAPIRRRLRDDLHELFATLDVPILYVTHDQRTAAALGDRIAVFREGRIEQEGPAAAVIDRPATRFVAEFTGTENVFEATVTERTDGGVTVRAGDRSLRAAVPVAPETTVTACIHPSRVELGARDGGDGEASVNTLAATVSRWVNEGSEYRVETAIEGLPFVLVATVSPPTFDRLGLAAGTEVTVRVSPESVHLIP